MTATSSSRPDLWSRLRASSARPTIRGAGVAIVGLVLTVVGPVLGRREAVAIGLFLITAAVASLGVLVFRAATSRATLRHRILIPDAVTVGSDVDVRFLSDGTVIAADSSPVDQLPPSLQRLESTEDVVPGYRLRTTQRGLFSVGPAREKWSGPLGLSRGSITREGTSELRVLPQIHDQQSLEDLLRNGLGDERSADLFGVRSSADDLLVREHRPTDPLSRIHWGATARTRQLMVRQEESTEDPRAAVILDCRAQSFPQSHQTVDVGDGTSWLTAPLFEEAVRLAASVHQTLQASGQDVLLMDQAGGLLSQDLVDARLNPTTREAAWMDHLPRGTTTVVAIWGAAADSDLPHLQRVHGVIHRTALLMGPPSSTDAWRRSGWRVLDVRGGAR